MLKELLGWLKGWPPAVIVVAVLAFCVYANERDISRLMGLITYVTRFHFANNTEERTDNYTISFWTPSAATQSYWDEYRNAGNAVPANDVWEDTDVKAKADNFAGRLSTLDGVLGFRRYDVVGKGRHVLKPGHWWTITAKSSFKLQTLIRTYREFWNCPDSVYAEVQSRVRADYCPDAANPPPSNAER
jgi:hypothetical protein